MSEETVGLVVPDFSQTQDEVEPGVYTARITHGEIDKWDGKEGKPDTTYIKWTMETFNEEDEKNNGRKIFHRTPIMGGGAFRFKQFYKAAMGQDCPAEGFNIEDLYGKEVELGIVDGYDKDKQPTGYTEVKTVKPLA